MTESSRPPANPKVRRFSSSTKWSVAFALGVTAAVVGGAVIAHALKHQAPVVQPPPTK